jgi:hypothetical protein
MVCSGSENARQACWWESDNPRMVNGLYRTSRSASLPSSNSTWMPPYLEGSEQPLPAATNTVVGHFLIGYMILSEQETETGPTAGDAESRSIGCPNGPGESSLGLQSHPGRSRQPRSPLETAGLSRRSRNPPTGGNIIWKSLEEVSEGLRECAAFAVTCCWPAF